MCSGSSYTNCFQGLLHEVDNWEPGGSVVGILSCLVPARTSPEFASAPALTIYRCMKIAWTIHRGTLDP